MNGGQSMRGIRFKIPNKHGKSLYMILRNVGTSKSIWVIDAQDAFVSSDLTNLFDNELMNNVDFYNKINKKMYAVELRIRMYDKSEYTSESLLSHIDFVESKCQLAISIIDVEFVSVYAKDHRMLKKLEKNAKKISTSEVEYITEENDNPDEYQFFHQDNEPVITVQFL